MIKRKSTILIIVLALLLVPIPTVIVPEWHVQAVDILGTPFADLPVRQEWSFSGSLSDTKSETLLTDKSGNAGFPERRSYLPIAFKVLARTLDFANELMMPHGARTGVYARVVSDEGSYYWLEYRGAEPLPQKLVIRKL